MNHTGFRAGNQQAILCMGIAHRAQTISVHPANDPVAKMCRNRCWPIPGFHYRIAIGIELCQLAIAADIYGFGNHHGFHHWQAASGLQQ